MRITGGVFRSRSLHAPPGSATRPTSDRVREALFSILAAERSLEGIAVLDLYAGTGALALEALSRGADRAVLVDARRAAIDAIRANVQALGVADRVRVIGARVERALEDPALEGPFDLVFADPPYADVTSGAVARALERLARHVADEGCFVLEHSAKETPLSIPGLACRTTRRYGDTALSFYDRVPV